jgi:fructokinase
LGGIVHGAIEAGGSKVVCALGTGPHDLRDVARFPTTTPDATLGAIIGYFRAATSAGIGPAAVGLAAFGPIETRPGHPRYGCLLATPKPGWTGVDVVTPIAMALGVPVAVETDVIGAALAEGRWGAAVDLETFVYLTIGTGIGGGAIVGGRVAPGMPHAEMGHQSVARQPDDAFPGVCPFHGDCLEGLAAGPAIEARWGRRGEDLDGADLAAAVDLEARYLADGLRTIVYTIAPERIILGGGAVAMPDLLPAVRRSLHASLAGYPGLAEHADPGFIVPAALGGLAGVLGGLIIAERAASATGSDGSDPPTPR